MRVLVTGSRRWTDVATVERELRALKPAVVIHGAAKGADTIADDIARAHDLLVIACPAQWDRFGKAAGPIRNGAMLREHKPDRGLALGSLWHLAEWMTPPLWRLTGTGDMVHRLLNARLPLRWVPAPGAYAVELTAMPTPEEQEQLRKQTVKQMTKQTQQNDRGSPDGGTF